MASNDCIVLDGILSDRKTGNDEGLSDGEVFELFVFEQVLKDYALSRSRLEDGWVDGGGDGGIDGFYVIVNGYPYNGEPGFQCPRESPHVEAWVFTCKHKDGFEQAPLESMHSTLAEFWDCARSNESLLGTYSEDLLEARNVFLEAYNTLAHLDPLVHIHLVFASRGDSSCVAEAVQSRMNQLKSQVQEAFSHVQVETSFVGAADLLSMYRAVKNEDLVLPFEAFLTHDDNNYVVISTLKEYYEFVKDESGRLRRYLFDSNVRDFLGYNSVNEDIDLSLKNPTRANFWWLNNGITVLATNAHTKGKNLYINGVQIVNGLQTTETLYRHFNSGRNESLTNHILIKVLTSQDASVREQIIKATNNQSNVISYSLHATDDIQRNIEDVLRRSEVYYERRDHYYKNEGVPANRVIKPLELAKGFLAIVFKNPKEAVCLKNRFMRNKASYDAVFLSDMPLDCWTVLAELWLSETEAVKRYAHDPFDNIQYYQWIPFSAFCVVAKHFGSFDYKLNDFYAIRKGDIAETEIHDIWEILKPSIEKHLNTTIRSKRIPRKFLDQVLDEMAATLNLPKIEVVNKRKLPKVTSNDADLPRFQSSHSFLLTPDLVQKIKEALPPQPWVPGIHRTIAQQLSVSPSVVHEAIDLLIERNHFYEQKNGILYDKDGRRIN